MRETGQDQWRHFKSGDADNNSEAGTNDLTMDEETERLGLQEQKNK